LVLPQVGTSYNIFVPINLPITDLGLLPHPLFPGRC
jgi:hypothetical protein